MDLDATQALDLDEYDEQEEQESKKDKKQVGQLKVFRIDDIEEKIYDIHAGENFIGRDERSDVFIPRKSLSKTHACIEVYENLHLVYDDNSKNRTRRDKMILKPQVRYELHHGDMLTLADTKCQYFKSKVEKNDDGDETGSETGSESMLPIETTRPDDGDISKDAYAVDTESETDDEKDPVKTNKPVVYSSDERLDKENAEQTSGLSTVADDSDQHKPIVPAFMYDSNDDDDDDDKSKQTCQKSYEVKEHMDMSADSGTLAFGLVSPDEVPIIRPTSKKIPVLENTPVTLVYSPDTEDRTPDNLSLPKSKEEGNSCSATLIYGSESPYQDKSPVKGKVVSGQKDSTEKSKSRIQIEPEMRVKNASESQKDIEACDATMPVYELGSLKETPVRDLPEVVAPSCEPTMLYGPGTLKETPLNDMPEVGETPSEAAVYLPETQGFCGDHEETSFCEPTQAYLRESPVDTLKETPMVSNVSDSEEEEISQSDTDVKKALSFDDSATQAYTYNDSDATDDEEDDNLRFQATQAYPSHVRQPEKDEESKADTSSLREDLQQTLPYAASPPQHEQKTDFTASSSVDQETGVTDMETQAYDSEVEDETSSHSDMGKRSEVKHDEIEPTLPYNIMDLETQAYEAETEDTSSYAKDKPGGDHCGEEKMKTMKLEEKSASTVSDVKGLAIEPTLPYEISVMETQDYGDNEHDVQSNSKQKSKTKTQEEDRLISNKRALEPTIPYDVEMETQAYCYENVDNSDTDDEGQSSTSNGKTTVGAQGDAHGKTQAYNEDKNYDGDDDERTGLGKTTGDDQDVYGETQAYMYENEDTNDEDERTGLGKSTVGDQEDVYSETQAYHEDTNDEGEVYGETQAYGLEDRTTHTTAIEVIPDSEEMLSQDIPSTEIKLDDDLINNNEPDKKKQFNSEKQEMAKDSNQEEAEIIIRPRRRGRGRVTQPSEEQPILPDKPDDTTTKTSRESTTNQGKGKTSLKQPTSSQHAKVQRSSRPRRSKKEEVEAKGDDSLPDDAEGHQSSSKRASIPEKNVQVEKSKRGRRSKKNAAPSEVEDNIQDDIEDNQFSSKHASIPEKSVEVKKSTRGRRSKKNEAPSEVEDALPDNTVTDIKSSCHLTQTPEKNVQAQRSLRGRKSKRSEVEAILDDTKEDQLPSKPALTPKKNVEMKKSTRGRRSKKNEGDTKPDSLPDNTEGNSFTKPLPALTQNIQEQRCTRGRSKKSEMESKAEDSLPDDTEGNSSTIPVLAPTQDVLEQRSSRGRRSKKSEVESKLVDNLPCDTEEEPTLTPKKNEQVKRSNRGKSLKNIEVEPKVEDSLTDDTKDIKSTPTPKKNEQVKKSNRGRCSKKIEEEFKVEDSLPDNTEEDQFVFKKGKGKEKPIDQESSGMDSEELPPLELILSDKKLTKEKGKTRGKTQDIKKTPEESKKESLTEEAIGDEEVCPEPIVVKPFFSRRGRGRVTQSDDAVPGTSGSDMTEFQQEDLLSPQSVAKSISTRKGKGKKEEAIAVETETEMDITGSQNSTSSSVGSRTKTRGKGLKTDSDTTELNESQSSVSSSVESKPRGRARGRKAKATDLDDTHTPDLSESQSSTTSSVDNKTRGKGRKTKTAPLDDTQTEEFQVTPSKRNKSTKQENSPTVQSPSLRERKHTVPRIMFTGVSDKQAEKVVTSLGGTLVDSVYDCTHLITDKVRRTVKFLCGVASGQIIVQPMWLTACKKAKRFIEPESFIVSDKVAEKQYSFSLQQSHEKALKAGLLEGYKIHITKNVKPEPNQMKDIIKCAKGEYLARMPHAMQDNILVVSCEVDQELCKPALSCGIPVYSAELLLTGILRQDLQLDQNRLFEDHVNQPSTVGSRKRKNESEDGETSLKSSSSRSLKRKKK